jgi:hypothetical protein
MKMLASVTVSLFALAASAAAEESHVGPVKDYIARNVAPWLSSPEVIDAIKKQNAETNALDQAGIDALDNKWKAETDASARPMIDEALARPLSRMLAEKQAGSAGVITEIFVVDAKGLNVGQSEVTSDYWQGDEAKFQKSFGAGPDAIFVDDVEKDESTQALQSQASVTIDDPATGQPIGAITLGINLDKL